MAQRVLHAALLQRGDRGQGPLDWVRNATRAGEDSFVPSEQLSRAREVARAREPPRCRQAIDRVDVGMIATDGATLKRRPPPLGRLDLQANQRVRGAPPVADQLELKCGKRPIEDRCGLGSATLERLAGRD